MTESTAPVTETDAAARIAAGYATGRPAVELGSVVLGGRSHPDAPVRVPLAMLTRHGLIAGATGTGKTKTLQLLAEQLSAAGVPVVLADVNGDLARLGEPSDRISPAPPTPAKPGRRPPSRWSSSPSAASAPGCPSAPRSPTSGRC